MSATEEVENATAEQQPTEVPPEEQPEKQAAAEKKPAKEKKAKAPKEKKPKAPKPKTASHPPYFEMIKEAVLALNEKSGSSPYAIAKYMEEKHKAVLPANFRKILGLQLKNSAAKGKLIKIKASYKLSEAGKKDTGAKKPAEKKVSAENKPKKQVKSAAAAKPKPKPKAAKKKSETAKKVTGKTTKKRSAPAAKPKQPKSIKSPAAKKAKRATAAA